MESTTQLDETWVKDAKSCYPIPFANYYTNGASDFQDMAIKDLEAELAKATDPDFKYGIEVAIDIMRKVKPPMPE